MVSNLLTGTPPVLTTFFICSFTFIHLLVDRFVHSFNMIPNACPKLPKSLCVLGLAVSRGTSGDRVATQEGCSPPSFQIPFPVAEGLKSLGVAGKESEESSLHQGDMLRFPTFLGWATGRMDSAQRPTQSLSNGSSLPKLHHDPRGRGKALSLDK